MSSLPRRVQARCKRVHACRQRGSPGLELRNTRRALSEQMSPALFSTHKGERRLSLPMARGGHAGPSALSQTGTSCCPFLSPEPRPPLPMGPSRLGALRAPSSTGRVGGQGRRVQAAPGEACLCAQRVSVYTGLSADQKSRLPGWPEQGAFCRLRGDLQGGRELPDWGLRAVCGS